MGRRVCELVRADALLEGCIGGHLPLLGISLLTNCIVAFISILWRTLECPRLLRGVFVRGEIEGCV